jgi:hypothetical protein
MPGRRRADLSKTKCKGRYWALRRSCLVGCSVDVLVSGFEGARADRNPAVLGHAAFEDDGGNTVFGHAEEKIERHFPSVIENCDVTDIVGGGNATAGDEVDVAFGKRRKKCS